ncbi:hypothetical protein ADUPG1_012196 [Aduncisulcus paluster]|uniref:Uncharacterized protein n=1 Tax=Aduncisulcus paluster TaxID=2918883 RepID=A0ABQ5JZD1_9EUKA|nr:hypothetical protein ADUPG1_012196 [Aduncisulcus paluster]
MSRKFSSLQFVPYQLNEEIAQYLRKKAKSPMISDFKRASLDRAANGVERCETRITSGKVAVKNVKGVGAKIGVVIDQIIDFIKRKEDDNGSLCDFFSVSKSSDYITTKRDEEEEDKKSHDPHLSSSPKSKQKSGEKITLGKRRSSHSTSSSSSVTVSLDAKGDGEKRSSISIPRLFSYDHAILCACSSIQTCSVGELLSLILKQTPVIKKDPKKKSIQTCVAKLRKKGYLVEKTGKVSISTSGKQIFDILHAKQKKKDIQLQKKKDKKRGAEKSESKKEISSSEIPISIQKEEEQEGEEGREGEVGEIIDDNSKDTLHVPQKGKESAHIDKDKEQFHSVLHHSTSGRIPEPSLDVCSIPIGQEYSQQKKDKKRGAEKSESKKEISSSEIPISIQKEEEQEGEEGREGEVGEIIDDNSKDTLHVPQKGKESAHIDKDKEQFHSVLHHSTSGRIPEPSLDVCSIPIGQEYSQQKKDGGDKLRSLTNRTRVTFRLVMAVDYRELGRGKLSKEAIEQCIPVCYPSIASSLTIYDFVPCLYFLSSVQISPQGHKHTSSKEKMRKARVGKMYSISSDHDETRGSRGEIGDDILEISDSPSLLVAPTVCKAIVPSEETLKHFSMLQTKSSNLFMCGKGIERKNLGDFVTSVKSGHLVSQIGQIYRSKYGGLVCIHGVKRRDISSMSMECMSVLNASLSIGVGVSFASSFDDMKLVFNSILNDAKKNIFAFVHWNESKFDPKSSGLVKIENIKCDDSEEAGLFLSFDFVHADEISFLRAEDIRKYLCVPGSPFANSFGKFFIPAEEAVEISYGRGGTSSSVQSHTDSIVSLVVRGLMGIGIDGFTAAAIHRAAGIHKTMREVLIWIKEVGQHQISQIYVPENHKSVGQASSRKIMRLFIAT